LERSRDAFRHEGQGAEPLPVRGNGPAGLAEAWKLAGSALYIPHLHYLGMPDPTKGLFTGSSRFNALRLDGGEEAAPLFSSRVMDTVPNILGRLVAISSRTIPLDVSTTYGRRTPETTSVPEWVLCDGVWCTFRTSESMALESRAAARAM